MSGLAGLRVVVAGAGAFGSAIAWTLQASGAQVVMADSAPLADNASGIAAGMLAPAFEALLDKASLGHYPLLRAARDAWPAFLTRLEPHGARIVRSGALWVGDEESQAGVRAGLVGLGAETRLVGAAEARALSPGLLAPSGAVYTPEDWRLDPEAMLRALRSAFLAAGGQVRVAGLRRAGAGRATLEDGQTLEADVVILATGLAPQGLIGGPAETGWLQPIKGQIARSVGPGGGEGAVVRARDIYVTPAASGFAVGATMEAGASDRRAEPEVLERLRALAAPLFPDLASARLSGAAGVRAASPDGLPLAGPSSLEGVQVALGARRNGWLLAPLIASVITDSLAGAEPGPWAPRFDPSRFGPMAPG